MGVIGGSQQSHTNFTTPLNRPPELIWVVTGRIPPGDFTDPINEMLQSYLVQKWGTATSTPPFLPAKSINPPDDFSTKVRFGDFPYDYYSTYYIRLKEAETEIDNDLIVDGIFQIITTVNIDLTARRLKTGEHFEEMNNMRLEVIRILGNFRPDQISGIHMIEIDHPGERDIEAQTITGDRKIWYLRIRARVHYFKALYQNPAASSV